MCKQGSWKKLKIGNKEVNIDSCLYKIVKSLNESGLETIACCCGHGKQPPRISLKTGQELMIFDYETAQEISKRFKPLNQFKKTIMSKTIIKPSNEDREKINAELEKVNTDDYRQTRFDNFQEIQIQGTFTLEELKEITKVIETAEAWLALESKTIEFDDDEETEKNLTQACIECGNRDKPIIKQCEKCGGAIRACCPNHEDNC